MEPTMTTAWTPLKAIREHPSGVLLLVQLLGLLLYPLVGDTDSGRGVLGGFGVVVLSLTILVVIKSPTANWIAWLLATPAVALLAVGTWGGQPQLLPWANALESALYFYAAVGLIAYMFSDQTVSMDELFAAGATFTLLAWAFGYAYLVCQALVPGSFTAAVDPTSARTWIELLFLSFAALSGVGLSDVIPITPFARALVMLEEFAGVMYIAIVVSRLIGLSLLRANAPR
jgi:hypothetical protein